MKLGGWEGRSSRILSIREAPLANNSTNKQREPPLLAFVDKKKGAPPKLCQARHCASAQIGNQHQLGGYMFSKLRGRGHCNIIRVR